MKSFENTVARFRKIAEMVDELKGYTKALTAERDALEAEIIEHCAEHPDVYNVFMRKTSSAGLVGRNFFTVTFSEQLERRQAGKRLDDQDWLDNWSNTEEGQKYQTTKRSLLASKIAADYKAGNLDDGNLRFMGVKFDKMAHVTAQRIPNDAELAKIRRDAEALAEDAED